ncbi:hypothetical protein PCANC_07913 [Puccinia coronata f. sp. avenae]|uniref:Uncharacterized protein n=1 Tax=Puccinia coronata f. sp. avenae TaxID=200324 RepID=A0A2N5UQA8_9BASI|nr:hypothetical protein PCASD_22391 [Puccinia coronata f. sp. avenae]PLW39953.1 hypothetical protein PCASD_06812 [Puccinia coronata f. sp. avenae]PLW42715.1 hypothetical protein PCANC_07913 [Puccinia coronata f. sp. avenae]
MKIVSFAILIILPCVLALLRYKKIKIPNRSWGSGVEQILNQPDWSSRSLIDFTGDYARRLSATTIGEEHTNFHLRVSKHLRSKKIYLSNDSDQPQTYLLLDDVRHLGLLKVIQPKEKHRVMASELRVYIKHPLRVDSQAQPHVDQRTLSDGRTSMDGLAREHHSLGGELESEMESNLSEDEGATLQAP